MLLNLILSKKISLVNLLIEDDQKHWKKCIFINCAKTCRDEANIQFFRVPREQEIARQWIINSGNLKLLKVLELLPITQRLLYFVCWDHFDDDEILDEIPLRLKEGAIPKFHDRCTSEPILPSESAQQSKITGENSPNMSNVSCPQPYVILASHSTDESNIEGEVVQELLVVKNEENCIDIDEMDIEDIKPGVADITLEGADICNQDSAIDVYNASADTLEYVEKDKSRNDMTTRKSLRKNVKRKFQQFGKSELEASSKLAKRNKLQKRRSPIINNIKFKSKSSKAITTMQILHRGKEQWNEAEKYFTLSLFYKSSSTYKFLQNQKLTLPSIDTIRNWIGELDFEPGLNVPILSQIKHKVSTMEDKDKVCTLVFANIILTRNPNHSNNGKRNLIFILRGIYSKWNLPLAYFVGEKETSVLSNLLTEAVEKVLQTGLFLCGILGDFDSQSKYPDVLTQLGVTPDKPYFIVKDIKVFGLLNIFSIFEMIKYHWTLNDFLFSGNQVSLRDVAYALKASSKRHFSDLPPVFCKPTSTMIKQAGTEGHLGSRVANDTAEFVKCMGNLYEVFNKKDFEATGFLFIVNKTLNRLKDGVYKVTGNENNIEELQIFKHLATLLKAVVMFCNEYKPQKYPNLVLNCPVSDLIKNIFAVSGSADINLKTFRYRFRKSFINNIMQLEEE